MRFVRSIFVAAVILAAGVAPAAANTINPFFVSTTPLGGGIFKWTYELFLSNGRLDADAGGTVATTPEQYFTFYDIRGYVPLSKSASGATFPTRWLGSEALIGKTPAGETPTDGATGLNVSFKYISNSPLSATSLSPLSLGFFSFNSTFGLSPKLGDYTSQDLTRTGPINLSPASFNTSKQSIEVPTPDGGSTAALLGSVLFAFGMLRRRFGKG